MAQMLLAQFQHIAKTQVEKEAPHILCVACIIAEFLMKLPRAMSP